MRGDRRAWRGSTDDASSRRAIDALPRLTPANQPAIVRRSVAWERPEAPFARSAWARAVRGVGYRIVVDEDTAATAAN